LADSATTSIDGCYACGACTSSLGADATSCSAITTWDYKFNGVDWGCVDTYPSPNQCEEPGQSPINLFSDVKRETEMF